MAAFPDQARQWFLPLIVLLIGAASTALVTYGVHQTVEAQDRERFQGAAERLHDEIRDRLDTYVAMLRAGAGLFAASTEITQDEFRAFVDRLELQQRYPGVQGIGYTARVPDGQLEDIIAAQRSSGSPGFTVWPIEPRSEYHSILFLEPLDARNQAAIGYDMFTEQTRREAMERARDTGAPAASGLVTLVQETHGQKQPGFLIYMPVYLGAETPASVAERRARLRGFVYSPFRASDLFTGILGPSSFPRAGFELFDGARSDQTLLHRSGVPSPRRQLTMTRQLGIAGRKWTVALFPTPGLDATSSIGLVYLIGWGGAAITMLLTGLVWLQARARQRAERSEVVAADASARFQQLANSIPQLAWMANPDGWIYWYNDRWYEYTGTTPEDMAGWGWQSVHDPEVLPSVLDRWRQTLVDGKPFEMEFPLRGGDGRFQWFLTRGVPFRDTTGTIVQWFGTNTNVQYRHDAERALLEQAETLNVINQTGAQLAGELELDRLVQAVTDAGTRLTRAQYGAFFYRTANLDGDSPMRYALSGVSRDAFKDLPIPNAVALFGHTFGEEGIVRTDDIMADSHAGRQPPFLGLPSGLTVRSFLAVPVKLRSGEVVGGLFFGHSAKGVFTAQTERIIAGIAAQAAIAIDNARLYGRVQQLLESERGARTDVERQSRMKDEFLATLSHELRTPLNAVVGWAHMLSTGELAEDKRKQAIATILRNAQAQSRLIEDLLDMSRIISGRLSLRLGEVDLADVIYAAVNVVGPVADAKAVTIEVAVDTPLPLVVRGDAGRLQQVVLNLLTNAIKFSPAGAPVDVRLTRTSDFVEVAVCDRGIGIAPEFLPHAFDRFRQADGSFTRGHGGLGLGLSIARSLIEMHAGTIRVSSDGVGKGATFTIAVPIVVRKSVEHSRSGDDASPQAAQLTSLQDFSVLVVEDDDDSRELAREVLSQHGASVVHARSGVEALGVLDSNVRFDLIISDVGMPEMDGYEFIRQVRTRPRGERTPAIAVTAYAGAEDQRRALGAGFDLHLAKPVSPEQLVGACVTLMGSTAAKDSGAL